MTPTRLLTTLATAALLAAGAAQAQVAPERSGVGLPGGAAARGLPATAGGGTTTTGTRTGTVATPSPHPPATQPAPPQDGLAAAPDALQGDGLPGTTGDFAAITPPGEMPLGRGPVYEGVLGEPIPRVIVPWPGR